jgi:hypothetical protein
MAAGADKADEPGRVAHNQSVSWYIVSHNRSGPDQGERSHRDPGQKNHPGTNGSAPLDQRPAYFPVRIPLQLSIRGDCARQPVIGEAGVRSHEHAILNCSTVIDAGTILDFDLIANHDVKVDVNPFADDALLTDACTLTNLNLMPDSRSSANGRLR